MIAVNVAMQQDKVIALLENLTENVTFTYKEKKGIKLLFEVKGASAEEAVKVAKESIKAQPWGSVLFFQCTPA
ncbi:hypothetical protein [Vagococcus xieshaowenii]|uniref:Uncharacterized protein n=1 Tax=Vagococcus xieshaowenii TaxID=2562451 RepID=A0AAJ5JL85_9ENTE|nr:hypothetical protein [Vagococcus xieshaowenii]QCA29290.1 hypothetical protein E4Z98_08160 [Vagococcus xieshaowenii]TFZ42015.1 hypothetical protein E4031_04345 [Vagococcus xieshaowenii]